MQNARRQPFVYTSITVSIAGVRIASPSVSPNPSRGGSGTANIAIMPPITPTNITPSPLQKTLRQVI